MNDRTKNICIGRLGRCTIEVIGASALTVLALSSIAVSLLR